jgi:hypothetical protein
MRLFSRLEDERKFGAIRHKIFHQLPKPKTRLSRSDIQRRKL